MIKTLIVYLLTAGVFFSLDILWLGLVAKNFYQKHLQGFLSEKVNWTAAIIFYLLFIIGIFIFSILPAVEKNSLGKVLILGALFGFFTYATYDLTNLATLKHWPMIVVLVEILWGIFLTACTSVAGYVIWTWIKSSN